MTLPSAEFPPFVEPEESPLQQAVGLFFDSTEAYFSAIRAGFAVSGEGRPRMVEELARRANLMGSSLQMAAGIIYDSGADDRNRQVAELLNTHEQMHALFFSTYLDNYSANADGTDEFTTYLATDMAYFSTEGTLSERDLFLKAARRTCLINAHTWMVILNDKGKGLKA